MLGHYTTPPITSLYYHTRPLGVKLNAMEFYNWVRLRAYALSDALPTNTTAPATMHPIPAHAQKLCPVMKLPGSTLMPCKNHTIPTTNNTIPTHLSHRFISLPFSFIGTEIAGSTAPVCTRHAASSRSHVSPESTSLFMYQSVPTSARVAPVASNDLCASTWNSASGAPAAAYTRGHRSNALSISVRRVVTCPRGGTPPIA